jgi:TetR/AcrR family fatty acid metabolism transcriptional regulator
MDGTISDQSASRRERLRREREQRILDAAATVFANKGYYQATIRDIATLADVADGTIYNYFDNKFDLLIGIITRLAELERLPAELDQAMQGNARDFFAVTFQQRMGRVREARPMLKAVLPQVLVDPELRERFYRQYVLPIATLLEKYLQAQIERGHLRAVDAGLTTRVVQSTIVGLLILSILGDELLEERWAEVPSLLATLLFDGLNPETTG